MANRLKNTVIVAVAGALVALSHVAFAGTVFMKMNGFLCDDNSLCDADPTFNAMSVTTGALGVPSIPGLTVTIASLSNNPGGSGGVSFFDVTWSVSRSIGSGASPATVNIEASQSDFNFPAGGQLTHLESDINGSLVNGTVTGQQFISLTNTLFDLGGTTPGPQGPFNAAFTNSAGVGFTTPAVYAIYENLSISLGADGSSNGEFRSTVGSVIPEPGTVALLCFAFSALGFTGRRRKVDVADLQRLRPRGGASVSSAGEKESALDQ
jgi:PEP-CTERM motif